MQFIILKLKVNQPDHQKWHAYNSVAFLQGEEAAYIASGDSETKLPS